MRFHSLLPRAATRLLCAALLCGLLLAPSASQAWGGEGHRTVALIAQLHLSKKAAKQIKKLLGDKSMADVASWADEVRNTPEYKHTGPWHFVNLPLGLPFPEFTQQLKAQTTANAYQALQDNLKLLGDKKQPADKRLDALRFVVHIVGDIHQPMHVSRAEDKGGNDIQVQFAGQGSNLHRVWDSGLIKQQGQTDQQMAEALGRPDHSLMLQWRSSGLEQWLFESYELSAQQYAVAPVGATLDEAYYTAQVPVVRQRLQQGGIRLAEVLNKALD